MLNQTADLQAKEGQGDDGRVGWWKMCPNGTNLLLSCPAYVAVHSVSL